MVREGASAVVVRATGDSLKGPIPACVLHGLAWTELTVLELARRSRTICAEGSCAASLVVVVVESASVFWLVWLALAS